MASATPPPGTYQTPQTVVIATTSGTTTFAYTQDGSIPNVNTQKLYVGSATVQVTDSQTINLLSTAGGFASFTFNIVRGGVNIPAYGPSKRIVDMRSLSYGLSGQIQPYPVYQFSGYRTKWEADRHNPFKSIPPYV